MGSSLLSTLLLLLVGALLARLTANRLKGLAVPAIVLELLVGFLLGNSFLPYSHIAPLAGLTELGVLTLFFMVGLEVARRPAGFKTCSGAAHRVAFCAHTTAGLVAIATGIWAFKCQHNSVRGRA